MKSKMNSKHKILDSIETVINTWGWTLISEDWGNNDFRCACPLGCLLINEETKYKDVRLEVPMGHTLKVAELLEVSTAWVNCFMDGFDGDGTGDDAPEPEAWNIGQEIAKEFEPLTYIQFLEKQEKDES